jgi:nucleoid DNA-binding protein
MAKAAPKKAAKPLSKSQIVANIAETCGVAKKDVNAVLNALTDEIRKSMTGKGPGMFAIPGLVKIEKRKIPAKPARKNAPDPFNPGQFRDYPAKPATSKIKVRALKALRSMI